MKKKIIVCFMIILSLILSCNVFSIQAKSKAKINRTKLSIYVGKTYKLKIKNYKKKVKWSSSNKKVVSVNSKGKIKAKSIGKAIVKAKIHKKVFKCRVTVLVKTNNNSNNSNNINNSNNKPVIKPRYSVSIVNALPVEYNESNISKITITNIGSEKIGFGCSEEAIKKYVVVTDASCGSVANPRIGPGYFDLSETWLNPGEAITLTFYRMYTSTWKDQWFNYFRITANSTFNIYFIDCDGVWHRETALSI